MIAFDGCYWHGDRCTLTKSVDRELLKERAEKTSQRRRYIEQAGYLMTTVKECDFRKVCEESADLRQKLKDIEKTAGYNCAFTLKYPGCVDETEIIASLRNELLFGFIVCSVRIPEKWSPELAARHRLSPYEYFKDFSPIFATCEVKREFIGPYMEKCLRAQNVEEQSKRLLVGGIAAKNLLISTSLAKWYLDNGLLISEISTVIEFGKQPFLEKFCSTVTEARREAGRNPDRGLIASVHKLIGNSAYVEYF